MEHITAKKNRLMTMLLTILFAVVIFGCALFANFGFGATAEGGSARAAYKYELKTVSVSFNNDWIFTSNTPDSALYRMVSVSVTYAATDGGDDISRVLDLSASETAATGEGVKLTRDTTTRKVTATVTPAGADYDPTPVSGTSAAYTLSNASQVVVNGVTAVYVPNGAVTTVTDLTSLKSCITVNETYNDGSINPGGAVGLDKFSLTGDLFPSALTSDIIDGTETYNKAITVTAVIGEDNDEKSVSTSVLITGIQFTTPYDIYIDGDLQTPVARSPRLNMNGLTVMVEYRQPRRRTISASPDAFPADYFSCVYKNASGDTVNVLNTSVKTIELTLSFPGLEPYTATFNNITVSRISIHTPTFPGGLNAVKATRSWDSEGVSVDVTGWDFDGLYTDSGDAPAPVLTVSPANAPEGADLSTFYTVTAGTEKQTVEFLKAGYLYHLYVTLPDDGDFMWGSAYNGNKSGDNMTMSFDVQVDKGTPVVTLADIADAIYGTPNGGGTITAEINGVEIGLNGSGASDWTEIAATSAGAYKDQDNAWYYTLKYYTSYTSATVNTPVAAANLRADGRPKNCGTYYAVATTYENGGYKSVTSNAVSFKVNKYTIDTNIADKTFARTDWTINDFILPNDVSAGFPYGDTALGILDVTDSALDPVTASTKFRYADEYTVHVEVKSSHTSNYWLAGEVASDTVTFAIKTNEDSTFDFSVSSWVYGESTANPNIIVTSHSAAYYPSNTGTLNNDFEVKYYKYDSATDSDGNTVPVKGDPVTIPQTSGSDDFSKLEVGRYIVELIAKKDGAYAQEDGAIADDPTVDYTTVEYILPAVYHEFWVNASAIVAPYLNVTATGWALNEDEGGLLYTYDDTQLTGQPFTFSKWIGDGAANIAADGINPIITVEITYTTFYNEDTFTVALGANGTFAVNKAGNYTVKVTLNKNYSWAEYDSDNNIVWKPDEQSYSYNGYVARQQLIVLTDGDVTGATVYDSTAQQKTIDKWNSNALKITKIEVAGLFDGHTPVSGGITAPADNSNKFSVRNAGIYTVSVDIDDKDNYEWAPEGDGAGDEAEEDDEQKLSTLELEYTLSRAPMKVTWGTGKLNGTFDKIPDTAYPRFEFDGSRVAQSRPAAASNVFVGDVVTIGGYTLYNIADDNGADVFGDIIASVTAVGHYRIVVSSIGGAAAANYYLPENDSEYITQIATVYEIYAKTFARPMLDGGAGVIISGNDITVVYAGAGYRLSDFIRDFADTYELNGALRLDIKYGEDGENNPLLKDVLWDADNNIVPYTITVKPADNYAWSTGTAGETLTYTIKITQKTVEINWGTTEYETTYGEVTEPAPTVSNAEDGDSVTINSLGYKKGETAVADITAADAGEYVVYAATLDNLNYKIDSAQSDWSIAFTIKKKALAKPTLNGVFGNAAFGTPITASLYSNTAAEQAAWQAEGNMLFTAGVAAKLDKAWFTEAVADDDAVLTIDTSDTAKYAFDTATGVLTYYAAGIYTVTFTLTDSANYCWAGDGKETAFTDNEEYTCAWGGNKELTNKRKVIDAPALGSKRAMEAEGEDNTPLSAIFTGTIDGVAYGVQYGSRDGEGFGAPQAVQPDSTVRGQYYVLLTAVDKYNYEWTVSSDDGSGGYLKSSYITQIDGKVYKTEYTKTDGASVYLLYAITATQLNVELTVNNYTYGDNGYAIGDTVISVADKWVLDYTNENGDKKVFDYQNHHEHVSTGDDDNNLPEHNDPVYTFFKLTSGNGRVQVAAADLVEGLPWEAGDYEAEIAINFKDSDAYSPWTDTRKFTVVKREIVLEWTFGGETKQNDEEFTTTYNGEEQKPTYTITNVPKKTVGDVPTAPQLTFSATPIRNKTAFVDAATYGIGSVSFANVGADENGNFDFGTYYLDFTINPKQVTLTATAQTYTYGDSLTFAASDCLDDATQAQFYTRDGSVITMRVQDAEGNVLTNKLDVVYGGEYYLVPAFNTANLNRANYVIAPASETIPEPIKKAALTVEKRAITVTVTNTPSSVYSESIADITYTVTRDGSAVGAIVDSEADVFSIAARDGGNAVITSLSDVGDYYIILTISSVRGNNYDITFGTSTAAEGATVITHADYIYTITPKQIAEGKDGEGNDTIVSVALTYNGNDQKFLKDGYAVVIGNPEIEGNAPVWSYFKTDANYLIDDETEFTPFTESPTIKNAGKHYFVIKVTAANHTALIKNIEVTVGKAELTVKFDLTIMFGEENPATERYMFGLDKLRTENSGWTVDGFESEADRTLFYTEGANFYGLAGKAEYSVPDYDKDSLITRYDINFIAAEYDSPTLTCSNYDIVGEVGTLTVKKVELTVNINDLSVTYNEQTLNNIPSVNVSGEGYTVDVPNSTYADSITYVMTEAFTYIFTVSTTAHDERVGTSTTGKAGSYAISGTAILTDKYTVTFVGGWDETLTANANGTCGKYTITPAALDVKNTIQGYTGAYDEKWHGIAVDGVNTVQDNGDPTDGVEFATASDGTAVTVMYGFNKIPGALSKTEFDKLDTLSNAALAFRDADTYYVHYCLTNPNYVTVIDCRTVEITRGQNGLSQAFDFENNSVVLQGDTIAKAAWTYGYKVEGGFDPDGDNTVIEPEAMFKYASGNTRGKITFRLYYNDNDNSLLEKEVDADAATAVADMFAELFAGDGLNAGNYRLRVSMANTANYLGFFVDYIFKVDKRALTVKAEVPAQIQYGSVVPTFTDASDGLVVNSSKAGATADSIVKALGATPVYYTDYEQGKTVGDYRVYANGQANGTTDATHFTNYTVEFKDVLLTVVPREITVNIADKQNTYNLRGDNNTTETVQTLTFTVTSGSIYTAELIDGTVPEGGVFNNDNQKVLTLYTEAIKNGNTNKVKFDDNGEIIGYTIYAVFKAGVAENNYHINFASCSNKEDEQTTAIGYDGTANNAGSYIIKKAVFKVLQDGVYHKDGATEIKGTVYSGAVNYYVATLDDDDHTPLEFSYAKKDGSGNYIAINANQVVSVGEYKAIGSSQNPNYTAAELEINFEITKATLTLTATPTSVQYGTTLSGKVATDQAAGGAEATGRFDGFTYTSNSPTLLASTLSAYLANNTVGYETVGYTAQTSVVGSSCMITPVCKSDNNVTIVSVSATLTVSKREVTVTMVGWDEANKTDASKHNANAWCYYLGSHDATYNALVDSFDKNISSYIYIADENVVFGDSGNDRKALGITVSLPDGVNVGEHDFGYAAANNTNYIVTFTNAAAPKFSVQKAKLTIYAHAMQGEYSYVYGETIETLVDGGVYNVGALTYSVAPMQGNDKFVNLLDNRNIVFTIVDGNGKAYEAWKSGCGTYTVSLMIREGENEYAPTAATFQNYEIVSVVNASLKLKQRKIKATTENQIFGFDGTNYNGGLFGKNHNAVITFVDVFGNDANVDATDYRPSFTLSYNTKTLQNSTYGEYQTAGFAPTVVGEYRVTVKLGKNSNYVFGDGTDSFELGFDVNKLVIDEGNLGWDEVSFSTDGDDVPDTFTNFIENYVDDYFSVIRFVYRSATGDGTQIEKGDEDTLYTYYIKDQKMYISVGHNIGTYTISFALKDSATGNLTLKSAIAGEATVSFAVSTSFVTITVEMEDFTYGDQPSNAIVMINGGVADIGLTLTYAPVTSDNAASFAASSKANKGLNTLDGLGTVTFTGATYFNAGYYVLSATYQLNDIIARRYYVFHVDKRIITAPETSISDVTFNGSAQNVVVEYQTAYMRPELTTAGGSMTAANGIATFTATSVGTYNVRFILIDPANNVWDTDSADGTFDAAALTLTWNINKDETDNGTEDNPIVELPSVVDAITYGGAFDPNLITVKSGYNGIIRLYYMSKTDDNMPSATDEDWHAYPAPAFILDAGEYWLKVILVESPTRNFAPKTTMGSFRIVPKTVTATISGSMIYGTVLSDTNFDNIEITGLLYGYRPTIGAYSYDFAQSYANYNAGGDYEIILKTDENDNVVGIDAGSNYIVKAARGTLTITKRAVTVTIEPKSSDYSVTPDLSDVQYTAVGLANGEDKSVLGIEFETDATAKSAAGGTYWITIKAYDGTNYEVTHQRVLYVINPLEIEVKLVRQQNITYGDANIKGATAGEIKIANNKADEAFVKNDLQLVIRFTGGNGYDSFDVPTDAGTYTATLVGSGTNYTLIGTPSVSFTINRKTVDATAFFIGAATYTGDPIAPRVDVRQQGTKPMYAPSVYVVEQCKFTDAGTHNVTVSLADPANYVWSGTADVAVTLTFIINKANDEQTTKLVIAGWQYGCYDMAVNSPSATVKSGESIIYQYSADGKTYTNVVPENGNAGKYYVRATVAESKNYRAFVGEPVSFDIAKFVVASPSLSVVTEGKDKNDVYTGADLAAGVIGFNPQLMQIAYNGNIQSLGDGVTVFARDAGVYTVSVSLFNAHNYCWSVGDAEGDGTILLTWTVARKKIAKPTHDNSTMIVNGNTLVYIPVGFDSSIMTIENNAYSYGGTFNAKIKLKDTKNYEWATGDDTPFTITWSIVGADTVFIVLITVLSVLAAACAALILVQFLLNKRKKRMTADAMQDIENADAQSANTDEGGAE